MARACTVRARVEHILAATAAPAKLGWRKRIGTAAAILPVVIVSAGSIAYTHATAIAAGHRRRGRCDDGARKPEPSRSTHSARASIFAVFREGDDLFGQLSGQRKLRLAAAGDGTYAYPAAAGQITLAVGDDRQPSELMLEPERPRHARRADRRHCRRRVSRPMQPQLDSYVGWYELAPSRVLTVTRDGERLSVQETGRPKFEVSAAWRRCLCRRA